MCCDCVIFAIRVETLPFTRIYLITKLFCETHFGTFPSAMNNPNDSLICFCLELREKCISFIFELFSFKHKFLELDHLFQLHRTTPFGNIIIAHNLEINVYCISI